MPNGKTEVLDIQNNTTSIVAFEPTPDMYKWRNTAFELGYTATLTAIERQSNVQRQRWYIWIKKPEFLDWWQTQWEEHMKTIKWKLDSIGMAQAKKDFNYWKAMKFGVQEFENKNQVNNQINISDAVIERLKGK